jgi:acylphosphatase
MTSNKTLHVLIYGRVQGVGFRAWTCHQAQLHGLEGWVRNRQDGAVEAVFSGPEELVDAMLKACRQGPRGSVVDRVEQFEIDHQGLGDPGTFEVLETR